MAIRRLVPAAGLGRALSLYALLVCGLTWPLLRYFTTHVPGDGIDDPSLAWNLWWIKARLVDQVNPDIFHVGWMFHPLTINLGFYTLTPLNGLLSIPLQSAFSLVIANNLLLLSSFVLGGGGAYLLARQELAQACYGPQTAHYAALVAGMIYAFGSSKLFYASLGQFNIASSQWLPFCALYTLRLARSQAWRPALRNALLAGLFLIFQAWAELTYASFLILFVMLAFLWSLSLASHLHTMRLRLAGFAVMGLFFLLGIVPFLWAMAPDLLREGDFFGSGGGFADAYSADLMGYVLPTRLHPFWGHWVASLPFANDKGQQIFIGYTALVLLLGGLSALWRRAAMRNVGGFWLVATLFFWWMTLGAEVRWAGAPVGVGGPFALISRLPFFSGNRYPSRYSVMVMVGVAVLAAAGLASLLARMNKRTHGPSPRYVGIITAIIALLFLGEHLSVPLPLSDFQVPAIYQEIATLPGDFTLLELPTGWRNGARVLGKSDRLIMFQQWYQTMHGKRRLGGNTSRNPPYKFQYFTQVPLLGDLIALMNAEPDGTREHDEIARVVGTQLERMITQDRALASEVLAFLGVRYVTVHVEKSPPALLRFVDEALPLTLVDEWHGPDWTGAPSTIRLYQVRTAPPADHWTIDLAAPQGQLYLAEGWSLLPDDQGVRYATRPCAELLLNLPDEGGSLTLTLAGPAQSAQLALNGQPLTTVAIPAGGDALSIDVPPGMATALIDRLRLCFDHLTPVTALAPAPDPRGWPIGQSGAFLAKRLLVQSAGKDVGDFAHIWLDGVDLMQGQLGYNLVALDQSGAVLAKANFNTLAAESASAALATWVQQWPPGVVIAGAVQDEASLRLGEDAVNALRALGLTTDLRNRFRWSHAFVGVVGAPPASALDAATLLTPAVVTVGLAFDAPVVSGGVKQITFAAQGAHTTADLGDN
ncbi:MAG: interleukin-like EMT inducer domain-containing protein [Caldilineaceae bacterium]